MKEYWGNLESTLVKNIQTVWTTVRLVLCDDAPEGNVPDELESAMQLDTKDILSYSWRALKEARYAT